MPVATTSQSKKESNVGMAQIHAAVGDDVLRSVLGSCIGLALHHGPRKTGVFAHIVLPSSEGRSGPAGKFADSAIPRMLEMLAELGAGRPSLTAKLAGGANMFGGSGPIQIGAQNYAAVKAALEQLHIPILGEHVGGGKGRRVAFHPATGTLTVEVAGESPVEL